MYWNHRIVIQDGLLEVREVFYDEHDEPTMYGTAEIYGETLEELKECYKMIGKAIKREPLHYPKDFTGSFDRE